jgi:hypothetical protein
LQLPRHFSHADECDGRGSSSLETHGCRLSRGGTGTLISSAIASLDGYTADAEGEFDWAAPDEEVHAFINDLERGIGTYLYGRRFASGVVYLRYRPRDEPGAR